MRSLTAKVVLVIAVLGGTVGCAPCPSVSGTWTGKIVCYKADTRWRSPSPSYAVAALQITDGPPFDIIPQYNAHAQPRWAEAPVLVNDDYRIIDPECLGVGNTVRVTGRIYTVIEGDSPEGRPLKAAAGEPRPITDVPILGVLRVTRAENLKGRKITLHLSPPLDSK